MSLLQLSELHKVRIVLSRLEYTAPQFGIKTLLKCESAIYARFLITSTIIVCNPKKYFNSKNPKSFYLSEKLTSMVFPVSFLISWTITVTNSEYFSGVPSIPKSSTKSLKGSLQCTTQKESPLRLNLTKIKRFQPKKNHLKLTYEIERMLIKGVPNFFTL